ncbi:hypothetical protein V498_02413, partial [Pseudogymnoascus sp. VKM F-4517 (FW-2822)]
MAPGLTLHDSPPLSSTTSKLASPPTTSLSPTPSPASSPNTTSSTTSVADTTKPAPRPSNAFEDLVDSLTAILGPTSGLTSEGVDVDALTRLMAEYESKEEDWGRYALGDASRGYTRNLVDVGNGKSNLLILVWSPNKGSLIHDHADAHCLMRILSGTLRETRYATPPSPAAAPPTILKETTYSAGQVTYMSDSLGVHKISNPDPERMAYPRHDTETIKSKEHFKMWPSSKDHASKPSSSKPSGSSKTSIPQPSSKPSASSRTSLPPNPPSTKPSTSSGMPIPQTTSPRQMSPTRTPLQSTHPMIPQHQQPPPPPSVQQQQQEEQLLQQQRPRPTTPPKKKSSGGSTASKRSSGQKAPSTPGKGHAHTNSTGSGSSMGGFGRWSRRSLPSPPDSEIGNGEASTAAKPGERRSWGAAKTGGLGATDGAGPPSEQRRSWGAGNGTGEK